MRFFATPRFDSVVVPGQDAPVERNVGYDLEPWLGRAEERSWE